MKAAQWLAIGVVTDVMAGGMPRLQFNPANTVEFEEMVALVEGELTRALKGERFKMHPISYRCFKEIK